jgi:hypothetical protein
MAERHAELFDALREEALARLVEVRGSIDHSYATIAEDEIRPQFDRVLDKMREYLANQDIEAYRGFANRWMAVRGSEGIKSENLIHAVVAIGDVIIQVVQRRMGQVPEAIEFARAVVAMNLVGARLIVELLAEELESRYARRDDLRREGR